MFRCVMHHPQGELRITCSKLSADSIRWMFRITFRKIYKVLIPREIISEENKSNFYLMSVLVDLVPIFFWRHVFTTIFISEEDPPSRMFPVLVRGLFVIFEPLSRIWWKKTLRTFPPRYIVTRKYLYMATKFHGVTSQNTVYYLTRQTQTS
jgi:hypothetical protein